MKNKNIVLIASANWNAPTKVNVHFIAENLAQDGNRVLFVESLSLRSPKVSKSDFKKIVSRIVGFLRGPQEVKNNIIVISPLLIPFRKFTFIESLNKYWLLAYIRFFQKRYRFEFPILWMFLPTGYFLIDQLQEKLKVYHCADDYASNPGVDGNYIRKLETYVVNKVDLVLTISSSLYERFKKVHDSVSYLPNVADYDRFVKTQSPELQAAHEVSRLTRPILGYWGNLADYKIDWELLLDVAKKRPQWTICLIGPVGYGDPGTSIQKIKELPNVKLLGPQLFERLPEFAKGFDICILPSNTLLSGSFPMKFYEYLATGKPVVATSQPAIVAEYSNKTAPCLFADSGSEFVTACESILKNPDYNKDFRLSEAKAHSWEKRMQDIYSIVDSIQTN